MNYSKKYYEIFISILAVISIALVFLDLFGTISLMASPYYWIDKAILIVFTIDYFWRLFRSKNKWLFFKHNIFDLLAIIPLDSIFAFFRLSRLFRLAKLARLSRLVGILGKLNRNLRNFVQVNGFIYMIYLSVILIFISSIMYSISEKVPFSDAIWWAVVTATTVGYGDFFPSTVIGRLAAILLMFIGIGFVGFLTSTITDFFDKQQKENDKIDVLIAKIDELERKIDEMNKKDSF